jgi:hypothetical protein
MLEQLGHSSTALDDDVRHDDVRRLAAHDVTYPVRDLS